MRNYAKNKAAVGKPSLLCFDGVRGVSSMVILCFELTVVSCPTGVGVEAFRWWINSLEITFNAYMVCSFLRIYPLYVLCERDGKGEQTLLFVVFGVDDCV